MKRFIAIFSMVMCSTAFAQYQIRLLDEEPISLGSSMQDSLHLQSQATTKSPILANGVSNGTQLNEVNAGSIDYRCAAENPAIKVSIRQTKEWVALVADYCHVSWDRFTTAQGSTLNLPTVVNTIIYRHFRLSANDAHHVVEYEGKKLVELTLAP